MLNGKQNFLYLKHKTDVNLNFYSEDINMGMQILSEQVLEMPELVPEFNQYLP
jgi:hypothetical protein